MTCQTAPPFCDISPDGVKRIDGNMVQNAEVTLIDQVLNGRRECYRPLVEKYERKVFLLACSLVRNPTDAQDVAQEAFLQAYKNLHTLKDREKFGSWLFGITRNLCYAALRRMKVQPESFETLPVSEISNVVMMRPPGEDGLDIVEILLAKLDQLPEKYQVLLRLKYLEDYSYQEIAEMLDLPVDLVRSRLFEGRRLLREGVDRIRRVENGQ